jgi:hypothetical protein
MESGLADCLCCVRSHASHRVRKLQQEQRASDDNAVHAFHHDDNVVFFVAVRTAG